YGKRSKIILPDGSSLWINSGSCISYSSDFVAKRKLNVQGEVYLDVRKDAAHPFVVKTNRLEVTVLGTSFNVTDYAKD
ncbi:FecR family protein, partial [Klebsiella pneumoniae]